MGRKRQNNDENYVNESCDEIRLCGSLLSRMVHCPGKRDLKMTLEYINQNVANALLLFALGVKVKHQKNLF